MALGFEEIVVRCEGCRHSKPGRKRDCDVKRALLLPMSARSEFVEWARGIYGDGNDCKYREPVAARR